MVTKIFSSKEDRIKGTKNKSNTEQDQDGRFQSCFIDNCKYSKQSKLNVDIVRLGLKRSQINLCFIQEIHFEY